MDYVLAMLTSPAAVAAEASCCGAAPVKTVCLVLPCRVVGLIVAYFAYPVPRTWIQDVLEAGDLRLRANGCEFVDDAEGIGSFEESVC